MPPLIKMGKRTIQVPLASLSMLHTSRLMMEGVLREWSERC